MAIKKATKESKHLVAEHTKRLRGELGLSQEELAEKAEVHRTMIGFIERKERGITVALLFQLAEALGVEAYELLKPLDEDSE